VFTKVIDKKTLNVIMVTVVSFYSTVIPLNMALMPDPVTETGGVQCLGPDKYAALGTAWRLYRHEWHHQRRHPRCRVMPMPIVAMMNTMVTHQRVALIQTISKLSHARIIARSTARSEDLYISQAAAGSGSSAPTSIDSSNAPPAATVAAAAGFGCGAGT
jgi:hypothetical protein